MYFIPVYWMLNWLTGTYTLILIQCSLILVAAWYSYKIVRLKTNNFWLGIGVLLYYFLLLGRYTSFGADVNLAIMSACFIPIFLYYFEKKKYLVAMVILVLSLFSRENIPLWFIFIFIVLIIQHRKDKKAVWFSLAGIVVSIIFFVLLFKVFIPLIEAPGTKYALFNYSALGANPGEALSFMITHPIESIKLFFVNHLNDPQYDGVKIEFYLVYLISGGFVLLLRPQYLIWFIPIVAQKVLNDAPVRWGISCYYAVELVTLLPISVFLALASIKSNKLQNWLAIMACIGAIGMTVHKFDVKNCKVQWMMNPKKEKFYDKRFYQKPFDLKKVNKLLSLIPDDAKVSASNMFVPHLAQRQKIYFFPTVNDAEYIVFSVFDNYYLISQQENETSRLKYLSDPKWEVVSVEYPVFLLKYNEKPTSNKSTLNVYWAHSDTLFCNYEKIDTVNGKALFSNGVFAENLDKLSSEECLSTDRSLKIPAKDNYSSSVKIDISSQVYYVNVSVWCNDESNHGFIAASGKDGFYKASFEYDSIAPSGWRRLVIGFWIPQNDNNSTIDVYLGSTSPEPIYFDDLRIVLQYEK
jgi:uncharacterized membrane protein